MFLSRSLKLDNLFDLLPKTDEKLFFVAKLQGKEKQVIFLETDMYAARYIGLPDNSDFNTMRLLLSAHELQIYLKIEFKGGLPPSFLKMQISCWQICYWSDVFCEKFAGKLLVYWHACATNIP